MPIKLYDSLSKKYKYISKNDINIYSCGITPYKQSHVGNYRLEIILNIIKNLLKILNHNFRHISNITDLVYMDDNTSETNKFMDNYLQKNYALEIYKYWKQYIYELSKLINNLPEIHSASNFIHHNWEHINKIRHEKYIIEDSSGIYIDTNKCDLNKEKILNNGSRIDKFAIWRNQNSGFFKDKGIPGWHIECYSIINAIFKRQDNGFLVGIHGAGNDLSDIHNPCECVHHFLDYGHYKYVRIWLHTNLVTINGKKISKRFNNCVSLDNMLDKMNISVFMILFLLTNYRKTIDINDKNIVQAQNKYNKIVKNIIIQVSKYYNIDNSYELSNKLIEIKKLSKISYKAIENTELINNVNTLSAINRIQDIKIENQENIDELYTLDYILNTQILETLSHSILKCIDMQYLIDKNKLSKNKKENNKLIKININNKFIVVYSSI